MVTRRPRGLHSHRGRSRSGLHSRPFGRRPISRSVSRHRAFPRRSSHRRTPCLRTFLHLVTQRGVSSFKATTSNHKVWHHKACHPELASTGLPSIEMQDAGSKGATDGQLRLAVLDCHEQPLLYVLAPTRERQIVPQHSRQHHYLAVSPRHP